MRLKYSQVRCARCGEPKIFRPDQLPFCSKCEKKMCEEAAARIKQLKGKKVVLNSSAVEDD